jgi:hypothetical protein
MSLSTQQHSQRVFERSGTTLNGRDKGCHGAASAKRAWFLLLLNVRQLNVRGREADIAHRHLQLIVYFTRQDHTGKLSE